MKKYYKCIIFVVLVLFVFLYCYYFLPLDQDGVWNYGFAYNITKRLIPYRDYNLIIPPLWPLLLSIPIFIVGHNFMTYYVIIAIIISVYVMLAYDKVGYRAIYILLLGILFPHNGYNIFCLMLFFILLRLLYSDKYKDNDILIAVIISLMFLTKQTMGVFVIPSIIFSRNKKKTICVYLVAILSTLLYLLINNNFWQFMDYCFFGLFDFSGNGNDSAWFVIILEVFILIYLIYSYIKTKDRVAIYILVFQTVLIPIFEIIHFVLAFIPVLFYFLLNNKKKFTEFLFEILVVSFLFGFYLRVVPAYIKDFDNRCMDKSSYLYTKRLPIYTDYKFDMVKQYLDNYSDYRVYMLSSNAYIYKLEYDIPINKYDLINDGNMGYGGDKKYVKEIDDYCSSNKCFIIVRSDEVVKDFNQISRVITSYVIHNYYSIYSSNDLTFYVN